MNYIFTLFFLLLAVVGRAQSKSDPSYYLIDDFNIEELTKSDQRIVDSCLNEFHNADSPNDKIAAIGYICDNTMDNCWRDFQVYNYELIKRQLEVPSSKESRRELLEHLITALNNLTIIEIEQGNKEKAIELGKEGIRLSKEASYQMGVATSNSALGFIYLEYGELDKALACFEKSNEINESENKAELYIQNKMSIAQINVSLGFPEKAMKNFRICLDHYKKTKQMRSYAVCCNSIALIHKQSGNYREALRKHSEASNIFKEIGDIISQAITILNIGDIYDTQKEYADALEYYREALRISRENGARSMEASSLNSIANIYSKQDKLNKALSYYNQSMAIEQEILNDVGIARCFQNLGNLYGKKGDFEQGIEFSMQGLALYDSLNFKQETAQSHVNLARLLIKVDKIKEASDHVAIGFEIATELGYAGIIKSAAKLSYKIAEMEGDFKQAFEMHVLYTQMKDSLLNLENKALVIRAQIENEHRLETYKIKNKEREKSLKIKARQQSDIREQRYLTALLLLLIISIVFIVLWRRSKYRLSIKWLQEDVFKSQMKPHFLSNVLVSIQSLIVQKRNKDAVEYLSEIAAFMRSNLNVISTKKISIEKEIALAEQYLNLEKLRFKEKLSFVINNSLDTKKEFAVSPLILQPLIENAIVHGFKSIDYTGEIEITIADKNGFLEILIEDNGVGLGSSINENSKGIKILRKRLSLANSKNKLSIANRVDEAGVRVKLLIYS